MIRGNWTLQTLEKRIVEGERLLVEFAHESEWLDLVQRELDRKRSMLAKLRAGESIPLTSSRVDVN